jgi:hypothetical protein
VDSCTYGNSRGKRAFRIASESPEGVSNWPRILAAEVSACGFLGVRSPPLAEPCVAIKGTSASEAIKKSRRVMGRSAGRSGLIEMDLRR